ncbi:Protein F16B3.3 a [Aphelenchoides avenae]|nr:Protein F16B3.3 a [Aphelenchus avenae]
MSVSVGRGCSAQFLTNEQYMSKSLGVQSKPSDISKYLNQAYGQLDIWEHWCFCATDECNTDSCFAQWQYAYHPQHRNRHYNFDFYEPSYWGTSYNHAGHATYSTIFSSLLPLVFITFMTLF